MKALVTGAAGFIGCHVVRKLLEDGVEVRAFLKRGEDRMNLDSLPVEIVEGDILDPQSVEEAMAGCEELYHLAAIYAIWLPDDRLMYRVNVHGSEVVLAAAQRHGVEKVVYTASIAAVGHSEDGRPINEDHPWNFWEIGNAYVRSKYYGEQVARRYAKEGLPVVIVNPAFPFGARDIGPTPTGAFIRNAMNFTYPAFIEGGFNAVDVEDVAMGHVLAARKGRIGERYILGHRNLLVSEFFKMVGDMLGVPVPLKEMSLKNALRVAAVAKFVADHVTHKPAFATPAATRVLASRMWYDCSKAIKELGLPQSPLEDAIVRAAEWFR
ncbi:MAG: NAD-dependent epimerase/dehydratase family protein, partial [Candidatus Methylomirabilis sp.]|nr:NAD-dependent epimerase/dehydratase family protein [Deltaproteobacteria bacterium]